ncbi:MAG: hypothetical protein DMF58_21270 [Acidobacteria bacterium]|nr:MAG: hypothetical protein DMF58_21270 [Acidobacteriota bacterium]
MKLTKFVFLTVAIAALSMNAFAQLPTTKILTMDVAQTIAQGAMTKCRADGFKVTVLVVDGLNAPKALIRDDGASASTTEVARMKATATMLYNRPSGPANPPPQGGTAGDVSSRPPCDDIASARPGSHQAHVSIQRPRYAPYRCIW